MRRIIVVLTTAAVMVAMMVATSGVSASAQDPCPSTGPSGGPATLISAEEPRGAGFVCLGEKTKDSFARMTLSYGISVILGLNLPS